MVWVVYGLVMMGGGGGELQKDGVARCSGCDTGVKASQQPVG